MNKAAEPKEGDWLHHDGPCLLCKGAQEEQEFDYCRACGFTVLPIETCQARSARYQKQEFRHDPDSGVFGDCYRTCLACLLGVPRDQVPHLVNTMDSEEWAKDIQPLYDKFLGNRGLQELAIPLDGATDLDQVLEWQRTRTPHPTKCMLTGRSSTGCNHVVIVRNGQIDHDPSLDDAGIVDPCDDGLWWITWLVPRQSKVEIEEESE